jgi:flagellin-like protein
MEHIPKSKRAVRASRNDEAVSPVIATILMVAITVVLAAAVYYYLTGFGASQQQPANAAFGVQSIDRAGGDGDSVDDAIQIVLVRSTTDIATDDATNGVVLNLDGTTVDETQDTVTIGSDVWTIEHTSVDDTNWKAGDSITMYSLASDVSGPHSVVISVRGQVVHSQSVEIHDTDSVLPP